MLELGLTMTKKSSLVLVKPAAVGTSVFHRGLNITASLTQFSRFLDKD